MPAQIALSRFLFSRYGLGAAATWLGWLAALQGLKAWLRAQKDPAGYAGVCYKSNGYAVRCTLDDWLLWEARPIVDLCVFFGALAAAAVTGYLFLRYLGISRPTRPSAR